MALTFDLEIRNETFLLMFQSTILQGGKFHHPPLCQEAFCNWNLKYLFIKQQHQHHRFGHMSILYNPDPNFVIGILNIHLLDNSISIIDFVI